MPAKKRDKKGCKVAIVQSTTLKGKEVKQVLTEQGFSTSSLKLLDIEEYKGKLTHFAGEAKVVLGIEKDSFAGVEIAFFCGSSEDTKKYLPWALQHQVTSIDLSQAMGDKEGTPYIVYGINDEDIEACQGIIGNPHPATILISTFLHSLGSAFPVKYAICTLLQPVSEQGEEGIEELYNQTVNLLNFNKIPVDIFKKQLAFNLLPLSLLPADKETKEIEAIITKQITKILKQPSLSLALRVIQAPVFHSYAILLFVHLKEEVSVETLQKRLWGRKDVKLDALHLKKETCPSPVEVAGKDDIYLGQIKKDANLKAGYWFWLVADNIRRGSALNAVRIAELLISRNIISGKKGRD